VLLAKTLHSTTFRLALLSIGVFGAVVVGLLGYVYWSTTNFVLTHYDSAIEAERALLLKAYDAGGRDHLIEVIRQREARSRIEGSIYSLADVAFATVAGNLDRWPSTLKSDGKWSEFSAQTATQVANTSQSVFRARAETLPDGFHLLVGRDISDLGRFANKITWALFFVVLLILVLAVVASVTVTRRTVGRIESINATSRAIMVSGLGRRIPLRGTGDEWDHLAQNLNTMLERIEELMTEVKQVSDSVAHDLRTPLTRIRGRLEKASVEKNSDRDWRLIHETIADIDDVLRMFSSLMRISQIEATNQTDAFRTVNLLEIATEVAELFDAAAESKGGHVKVIGPEKPVFVTADRDLLFDAIANLVDNSLKHGRDGGLVSVSVDANDSEAMVSVSDDGPGIPAGEVDLVFRRFYRLERSRSTPGNGLGLSLVAAVVRLHGASVTLCENNPGLCVKLHFRSVRRTIGVTSCDKSEGADPAYSHI
jgi:signal transduction histidine kinase